MQVRILCAFSLCCGLAFASSAAAPADAKARPLFILQSNDVDPTVPTSQPGGRWYHWLGADAAVTHLETGFAIDANRFAGRGQRIVVRRKSPVTAVQVKVKRIGQPGALRWKAGSGWGKHDLGKGEIPASQVHANYEHFVTLPLRTASTETVFLQFSAISGRCPDDYYAIYCTWSETNPEKVTVNAYDGLHEVGMAFRALRTDPDGAALERSGQPASEGASMMTRLLTTEPGEDRRELLADEEDPYQFVEALAAGHDPRRAGLPWPNLQPEPGEIALSSDWRIQVATAKSPQVVTTVRDLEEFLRVSLKVPVKVSWNRSAKPKSRTITLTEGPDLPDGPRKPAGYRYEARNGRVTIHGFDARGVLRGVWFLEDLLMLRGGPLLKPDARTREPRFSPRATCSTWGGMGELATSSPVYTDEHLALISHYGYDAIWLAWYPGSDDRRSPPTRIAPGRVPEGTSYRPFTARLRDLTERAERYDLEVIVLYAAPHPRNADEQRQLQAEARQLLRDVPKLKTIELLDEAMGSAKKDLPAWIETCGLLAEAFRDVRPQINLVAGYYTFHKRDRSPLPADWERRMNKFTQMDRRAAFLQNFDSIWARRRDGLQQFAFDYSISLRAPSDDYRHAAEFLARESERDGLPARPLWAKIETRFSQECNTVPEIPCMQRWAERYRAVADFQPPIKSLIANWYHQGFYPTPVTELFAWLSYTGEPPVADLLRAMARRDFGPGQESLVLGAWQDFSEAIWHYPFYYGLSYPMNTGCAQPFWLEAEAANPRPWRRGFVNQLETMQLADSGEGPGSGRENRARLAMLWTNWTAGLEKLQRATEAAPAFVRERAEANWRTARSFGDKAEVTLRLVRWFDARERLQQAKAPADRLAALDALEKIGRQELAAARAALPLYLRDSRMGHLNHGRGCFTAETICWKINLLEKTLAEELPTLRAATVKRE